MKNWMPWVGLLFLTALAGLAAPCGAQAPSTDDYILRIGDRISITAWGFEEHSVPQVEVRPDGKIVHPFAGEVPAAGRTCKQVAEVIARALRKEVKDPIVTVTVLTFREDWIFVSGAVARPGVVQVREPLTVQQAVASAGGVTPLADVTKALLMDSDGTRHEVNLDSELRGGPGSGKVLAGPGSTLIVSQRSPENVAVLGAVLKPGIIELPAGGQLRITDAIALAGGFSSDAAPDQGRFTRSGAETATLDLKRLVDSPNDPANGPLKHGDAILIPTRQLSTVAALGAVREPGVKPLEKGLRITGLVGVAGGLIREADPSAATLMRADGTVSNLDLKPLMEGKAPETDLALQPGDTLIVPELKLINIVVLGAVRRPGMQPMGAETRFADALAAAGGLEPQADRKAASVMRRDAEPAAVDLESILANRDAAANIALADGDTIIIESLADRQVSVLGSVNKPGRYSLAQVERLADLVAVGGLLEEASPKANLMRANGTSVAVDLDEVLGNRNAAANLPLADGDTLVVANALRTVSVLGAVKAPAQLQFKPGVRFSDAIARAGGLSADARARVATIMRLDQPPITVDLDLVLNRSDAAANVPLEDGDTIVIQAGPAQEMAVLGRVNGQGKLILHDGDRVSDAIARSGGLASDADDSHATIMRADGTVREVDLEGVLRRSDARANLPLLPGDTLVIGAATRGHAGVIGAVRSPGLIPIERGRRISDILALAGGPIETADLGHATLKRADGKRLDVDLSRILADAATGENVEMQNGDSLYLPSANVGEVAVLGAVRVSGRHPIGRQERVSAVIARAGGLAMEGGIGDATFMRRDGKTISLNVLEALARPGGDGDPVVGDGDTVIVNAADPVTVLGAVATPGVYQLGPGARASGAAARAGGPLPLADLANATVMRKGGVSVRVDLEQVLKSGDTAADMLMQPGDLLLVPQADYRISVIGAVNSPGRYPIPPGARLTDAIALAQGLREKADQTQCALLRGGEKVAVELGKVMREKQSSANVELKDGDTLIVDLVEPVMVSVLGKVQKEGQVELEPGSKLSDAVAKSGGLLLEGDAVGVKLMRGGQTSIVNVEALLRNEPGGEDPVMQAGDLVVVPPSTHRVAILGLVQKPGPYFYRPGERLLDVVYQAGGWVEKQAAIHRAVLTSQEGGELKPRQVNLAVAMRNTNDEANNPVLQDGDILYVPATNDNRTIGGVVQALFPVASILRWFMY